MKNCREKKSVGAKSVGIKKNPIAVAKGFNLSEICRWHKKTSPESKVCSVGLDKQVD